MLGFPVMFPGPSCSWTQMSSGRSLPRASEYTGYLELDNWFTARAYLYAHLAHPTHTSGIPEALEKVGIVENHR